VDQVEAFGNVRIVQENRYGESDHAVYFSKTGKITLDGNPKVVQGRDVITGTLITYFVDEQKSVVTSGPGQRVNATIHPKDKEKNAGAKP
jgi:lipopolysaccharide export system protein LptA